MSRFGRMVLFGIGTICVGLLFGFAFVVLPAFGGSSHPYRTRAVDQAVAQKTANVVASVNFDQRAIDTFGEETILLGSVVGVAVLLRPAKDEEEEEEADRGRVMQATRLGGYLFQAVTLIIGIDVVVHGHVTPGGGFQGGVILATGVLLLYVAGRYRALRRLTPLPPYEGFEALGAAAFGGIGIAGIGIGGAFLANIIAKGTFGDILSAGTVPVLNIAVGFEVACGTIVLLTQFLRQTLAIHPAPEKAEEDG